MCRTAVIFLAFWIAVAACYADETPESEDAPIVQTSLGMVKGYSFVSSWTNRIIYAFQGIPYAAPPVGELRFKDPVLPESWNSVKDCTEDQNSCMQNKITMFSKFYFLFGMSEDCLYLNVYTPELNPEGELLPVMVWLHGGGFLEGSGSRFRYGPDFLVAERVVVVSINYRLGAFGFLTLGNSEVPGNAGLKDQRLALQWVQREISNFGGDPGRVTLFGESAGSSSVHFHYLSPLSKGLFQRAIGESGTSLNWAFRENGTGYSLNFVSAVGCYKYHLSSIPACLRNASAESILLAQQLVRPLEEDSQHGVGLVFVPCVDKCSSTQPFLPNTPRALIEEGQGSHVPFMMGVNRDEGMMALALHSEDRVRNTMNHLEDFVHQGELRDIKSDLRLEALVRRLKHFYFKNQRNPSDLIRGYINLHTDFSFGYTTAESAKAFRKRSNVYLYYFTFQGSFKEQMFKDIEVKFNTSGIAHGEELNYLFVRKKINQTKIPYSRELNTWMRMVRMWTNFAKFGTPTVGADSLLQNVSWAPVGERSMGYLRIDENLNMETSDFLGAAVALWDSVIPSSGYLNISSVHTDLLR